MVPPIGGNNFGIIPPNCRVWFGKYLSFLFHEERLLFETPLDAYQTDFWFCTIYMCSQSL